MYNRYIQKDPGVYVPIQEDDLSSHTSDFSAHTSKNKTEASHESNGSVHEHTGHILETIKDSLSAIPKHLHLDMGDLFLLAILFFLYREKADEELLIALALLLVL